MKWTASVSWFPSREKKLIVGCTFASRKFEGRAAEGHVLLRAFLGLEAVQKLRAEGESYLIEKILEELKPVLNLRERPITHHLAAYNASMSYFRPGHLSQASRLEQRPLNSGPFSSGLKGLGIPDTIAAQDNWPRKNPFSPTRPRFSTTAGSFFTQLHLEPKSFFG